MTPGGQSRAFPSLSACVTLALLLALAHPARAEEQGGRGGRLLAASTAGRPNASNRTAVKKAADGPSGIFQYYGGPVISHAEVVIVLWGPNVDSSVASGLGGFYETVLASPWMDMLSEYSTVGFTPGTNQVIGHGTLKGTYAITPSQPNSGTRIYDSNIQGELVYQITQGNLPQPSSDAAGHLNTIYMIYFPPGTVLTGPGTGGTSCINFCAYHSVTIGPNLYESRSIFYGVFPDFGASSACHAVCGGLGQTTLDKMTASSSHELAEAVTDGYGGTYVLYQPPAAWYNSTFEEVGDICNGDDANGPSGYWVQLIWSNLQNECGQAPGQFAIAGPATAMPGVPFNLQVTAEDSGFNLLAGYSGTVAFASSDPAAALPSNYSFSSANGGSASFPVAFTSSGTQTLTVSDARVPAMKGTVTVEVSPPTMVTITASPATASFNVDGTSYSGTQVLQWVPGSTHILGVTSPQGVASGEQLVFKEWSDGGAASHVVVAPGSAASFTAYFDATTALQRPGRGVRPAQSGATPVTQSTKTRVRRTKFKPVER